MKNKEISNINVGICGSEETAFGQYKTELFDSGFHLNPISELTLQSIENALVDICIIDINELRRSEIPLQNFMTPFLISGVNDQHFNNSTDDAFKNSVGFISNNPSLDNICINVRLGLLRHHERRKHFSRVQNIDEKFENNRVTGIAIGLLMSISGLDKDDIFEDMRLVSRSKQRRVADVANDIISLLQPNNSINPDILNSRERYKDWLGTNIKPHKGI